MIQAKFSGLVRVAVWGASPVVFQTRHTCGSDPGHQSASSLVEMPDF